MIFYILCLDEKSLIISCDGLKKDGLVVFVDFYEIKCLCICIVIMLFVGELLVILKEVIISFCKIWVSVLFGIIFGCLLLFVLF